MTIRILRPNQEGIHNVGWFGNGSGSMVTCTRDGVCILTGDGNAAAFTGNKDSTYLAGTSGTGSQVLGFDSYTLASNQRCLAWRTIFRAQWFYTGHTHTVGSQIGNFQGGTFDANADVTVGSKGDFRGTWFHDYNGAEINQSAINNVQLKIGSTVQSGGFGNATALIFEEAILLDIRTRPEIELVTVTGGFVPTVDWTWTNIYDGQAQTKWWVQIFNLATNANPSFGQSTGRVYDSTEHSGTAHSVATGVTLTNGSYRVLMKVAKDFNGASWYSNVFTYNFTIAGTPPVPTAVGPTGTVNTDLPTLRATVAKAAIAGATQVKAEFLVASDPGFTTSLHTITEPDSNFNNGGIHTEVITIVDQLSSGTWYVKARAVDHSGVQSAYSAASTFTVNHPPTASGLAPDGGLSGGLGGPAGGLLEWSLDGQDVTWEFHDTSPVDEQTAFQAILETGDETPSTLLDSGKITDAGQTYNFDIDAADKDIPLRWKVRLWDRDDVQGPYSQYAIFAVGDPPVVTITYPTDPLGHSRPTLTWTTAYSGGRTQFAARIQVYVTSTGGLYYDSQWFYSVDEFFTLPKGLFNTTEYTFVVFIRDNGQLEGFSSVDATTAWAPPDEPDFSIDTSFFAEDGFVRITWDDAAIEDTFFAWRVYRKHELLPANTVGAFVTGNDFDDAEWELIEEVITPSASTTYNFDDYGAYANTQQYVVVQTYILSDSEVESSKDDFAQSATPVGPDYWLILGHEGSSVSGDFTMQFYDFAFKLEHVTVDDSEDEWEQETLSLLNQGRRVEYGTYLGRSGTLTCRLRDTDSGTARDKRLSVEWMKRLVIEQNYSIFLRTPFGDKWKVDAQALTFSRDAGLGDREHGTLEVPYLQVY